MRDALVVVDAVHQEVIGRVLTDVVMLVKVARRVVLRESLRLLSVVDLGEVVEILLLHLEGRRDRRPFQARVRWILGSRVVEVAASKPQATRGRAISISKLVQRSNPNATALLFLLYPPPLPLTASDISPLYACSSVFSTQRRFSAIQMDAE